MSFVLSRHHHHPYFSFPFFLGFFALLLWFARSFFGSAFGGKPGVAAQAASADKVGKSVHIHSLSQFNDLIASKKLSVVDYTATWCSPCQFIAPTFARLSVTHHPEIQFLKVDVDECPDVKSQGKVKAMPTFQFYRNGKMVDDFVGADVNKLKALIAKHSK